LEGFTSVVSGFISFKTSKFELTSKLEIFELSSFLFISKLLVSTVGINSSTSSSKLTEFIFSGFSNSLYITFSTTLELSFKFLNKSIITSNFLSSLSILLFTNS